jgi:chromosome segregation ATPase
MRCFDIYVDNPCCVLTQEESKKFIQGGENEKYEFFLKATGLQNLKEELMEMTKTLEETDALRVNHEKNIDKKRAAVKELEVLWEKIKALESMEKEIKICEIKALWVDYNIAKGVYDGLDKNVQQKLQAANTAKEKLETASRTQRDGDEIGALNAELARIQAEQADIEKESKQKNADVAAATKAVNTKKTNISQLERSQVEYRERLNSVSCQVHTFRYTIKLNWDDGITLFVDS